MKMNLLKKMMLGLTILGTFSLASCSFPVSGNTTDGNQTSTISVTGISLSSTSLNMETGDSQTLVATITPSNATNKIVTWTSSNTSVATVSSGKVKAISAGTTTITATSGGYSATCTVTVTEKVIAVTGVTLNKESMSITLGDTYSLRAVVAPSNASNTSVIWSSSNSDVAIINSNGLITAVSEGNATITVKTVDGNYTASCLVSVIDGSIAVSGVSLNYDQASVTVGKTITLLETISPYNATNSNVSWISSNNDVATVVDGVVTGISVGTSTITVTTADGGYTATCAVTVTEALPDDGYVPDTSDTDILTITESSLSQGSYSATDDNYTFTISQNYKQIYVYAPDTNVVLELSGVTIENSENSPIYVMACDSIEISAKKNTVNYVKDTRSIYTEEDELQGKGAIYVVDGDLKLKGTGTLNVEAGYYNGIHGKDDVKIQKETLNITAVNHGIKGNDSATITSGTINISCGGDGIHTENSDISSKQKQRGNVTINGGTITINSWGDAISAAYDAVIEETDSATPISITAKTNKNSSYSGEVVETSASKFYLKMNSSAYSNGNYTYAAYINGTWYPATYKGTQTVTSQFGGGPRPGGQGGSTTYYIYEIDKPSSSTSFKLYRFSGSNVTNFSTSSYNAVSDAKAFNDSYDMVQISVSSSRISFSSWSNYSSNGASAKGIKAENEITINSGTIDINAYDDGIHANKDGSLDSGATPLGNVTIAGGNVTISSADDGIHADNKLAISGGTVNVTKAYEGLEGNTIVVSGGSTYVVATDDGVNATSGSTTPNITVSGGLLDVTVPTSGDTDGIDSNGTYTQTGGVVFVKGPGSASGNTFGAAALDTDSTVRLTGGTLAVFGGIEQTPSSSLTKTLCSSSTVSAGSHTISFSSASYTTTLLYSTNGCVVYSALGSATLK